MGPTGFGEPPWTREAMIDALEEFAALYAERPIENNEGGMRSPCLFPSWFVARALNPSVIIESGVLRGQGSWFFEQACPDAAIYCLEPHPGNIQYRPKHAEYFYQDFATLRWSWLSDAEKDGALLHFDDHQTAIERVRVAQRLGFRHLMVEDNYAGGGDVYSLKSVWLRRGFRHPTKPELNVEPNDEDIEYLRGALDIYREVPPPFSPPHAGTHLTVAPLLTEVTEDYQRVYETERLFYHWLCYARIRREGL